MKPVTAFIFLVFGLECAVFGENAKIQDLQNEIMSIYEQPRGKPETLVNFAKSYLEELRKLNASLSENNPEAIELAEELHKEEGPKHVGIIPYGKLIDVFDWDGHNVSDYHTIIAHTRRAWDDVLRGIGVEVSDELSS